MVMGSKNDVMETRRYKAVGSIKLISFRGSP